MLAVSKEFRNAVRGRYSTHWLCDGTDNLYYIYVAEQGRRGPLPNVLRFGLFTTPLEDEDSEGTESDALGGSFPRTVFT